MPWIDPIEDWAGAPRLPRSSPSRRRWDGTYEDDDPVRIEASTIDGATLEAQPAQRMELLDCEMTGSTIITDGDGVVEVVDCVLVDCDLSRARIGTVRGTRMVGCKLTGSDLSDRAVRDAVFDGCSLAYANLRGAEIHRVTFSACRLEETDLGGASLADVTFPGSELLEVTTDGCRYERVDLRRAHRVAISAADQLRGCLIGDAQVLELSHRLALLAGATMERDPTAASGGDHSIPK